MTPMGRACGWAVAALLCLPVSSLACADVFRPAYLEIRELGGDQYDILLKVPAQGGDRRLSLDVAFPEGTTEIEPRRGLFLADAHVDRWRIARPGGLVGGS